MGKTTKDKRDIYYRLAKEGGWRARSAFKLLQIDEQFGILGDVKLVVDLCAAPGSWSQVLSKKLYLAEDEEGRKRVKIVAVDLQPMSPLPGVVQIQGDITEMSTAMEIISHFDGELAKLVVCDGAPDVTGLHAFDEYLQSQLVFSAFNITSYILAKGGTFVSKIFRAKNVSLIYSQMKCFFKEVHCSKPKSSRQSSCEAFIVCKDFQPPDDFRPDLANPVLAQNYECVGSFDGSNAKLAPFVACGDLSGFDSDRTYPLELSSLSEEFNDWKYEAMAPQQPPTEPAYKKAASLKKDSKLEGQISTKTSSLRPKVVKIEAKKGEDEEGGMFQLTNDCFHIFDE